MLRASVFAAYGAVSLHAVAIALALADHRMAFDELTQWLATRSAATPVAVLETTALHGRPPLYHVVLWPFAQSSASPATAKWLILLLGILAAGAIGRFSVQSASPLLLLLANPFLSICYFGMVRDYSLMALLAVMTSVFLSQEKCTRASVTASLLALVNLFGIMLALASAARLITSRPRKRSHNSLAFWLSPSAIVASSLMALYLSRPRHGGQDVLYGWDLGVGWSQRTRRALLSFIGETVTGTTADPSRQFTRSEIFWVLVIAFVVGSIVVMSLLIHRPTSSFLVCGLVLGIGNALFGYSQHWWHWGYFHVLLASGLIQLYSPSIQCTSWQRRLRFISLALFTFLGVVSLLISPMRDFFFSEPPQTRAREVAEVVRVRCPSPCVVVASNELAGDSLSAELGGRPLYYPVRSSFGTYAFLRSPNMDTEISWNELQRAASSFGDVLIVAQINAVSGEIPDDVRELVRFDDALNAWGRYVLYERVISP